MDHGAVEKIQSGRHPPVGFTIAALAAVTHFPAAAASRSRCARTGRTVIVGDYAETGLASLASA